MVIVPYRVDCDTVECCHGHAAYPDEQDGVQPQLLLLLSCLGARVHSGQLQAIFIVWDRD
jgi:hypothetical protein